MNGSATWWLGVAAAACLAWPEAASAQALYLEVEGFGAPERLRGALARDLGQTLTEGPGRPSLRVVVGEGREATLTYTPSEGEPRSRTVSIAEEPEAAAEELALVGSNLVRDQTRGLIVDPAPEAVELASPISSEEIPAPPEEGAPPSLAVASPLHLGVAGYAGFAVQDAPSGGTEVRGYGTYGLSLSGTVHPLVSLGVTRLALGGGYSSIEGAIFAFEATPFVELFGFLDPRVQAYVQLGVAVQGRTQTSLSESVVQVAPYLGAGVRFWVLDHFSLGVELGAHLVLTDAWYSMGVGFSQLSVPASLGVSMEWHIEP